MGQRGPAPKPTALRMLHGDRPRRVNDAEPVPGAGEVKCPDWLPAPAQAMWDRLAPDLERRGVLTPWDVDAFGVVVSSYVNSRKAQELVDRDGVLVEGYRGAVVKNPACQVARDSWATSIQGASRFGLTPTDRSQLSVDTTEDPEGPERLLTWTSRSLRRGYGSVGMS